MFPAKFVGGDYYDYIKLPEDNIGFVIADVSGKGAAAGLLMPSLQIALRIASPSAPRTDSIVRSLNDIIYDVTDEARYVSLFYGKLHTVQKQLEYTNAGHHSPLLYRTSSAEVFWLEKGGPVLGLLPGADYESQVVELQVGDILVFYTDGLVEDENKTGEEYSRQPLLSLVRSNTEKTAQELVQAIYKSVIEFRGTNLLEDDLALMVARVRAESTSV